MQENPELFVVGLIFAVVWASNSVITFWHYRIEEMKKTCWCHGLLSKTKDIQIGNGGQKERILWKYQCDLFISKMYMCIWVYMGAQICIYVYLPLYVYNKKCVWIYNMHISKLCPLKESRSKNTPVTMNTSTGQKLSI